MSSWRKSTNCPKVRIFQGFVSPPFSSWVLETSTNHCELKSLGQPLFSVPESHVKQRTEWQNRLSTKFCGRLPHLDKEIVNISTIQTSLAQTVFCIIQNKLKVPLWSCRKTPHFISTYQNTSTLLGFEYLKHFREYLKHLKNFEMNPVRKLGTLFYIPFTSQFISPEILSGSCSFSIIKNPVMIHSLC